MLAAGAKGVFMARTAVSFRTRDVVLAGVFGGAIFVAFEMVAAALLAGWEALFNPLRMIGAMLLGANALDQGYPLLAAATIGLIAHLVLSVLFATIFAAIAPRFSSVAALSLSGIVFGTILWLVNFYAVAPTAGWTWFPERTDPLVQFLAHAFFYGCPVGWSFGTLRTAIAASR
jgi:uncharacterized membrane protein YagU involved in acid resistance